MGKLRRTIHIMRTIVYSHPGGRPIANQGEIWERLATMDLKQRSRTIAEIDRVAEAVAPAGRHRYVSGRMLAVKFNELPGKRNRNGEESDLQLAQDEGLAFASHFVWMDLSHLPVRQGALDTIPCGVLVWEHNHQAPRIQALETHLNELFHEEFTIGISPVIDSDAWAILEASPGIGRIEVGIGSGDRHREFSPLLEFWRVTPLSSRAIVIQALPEKRKKHDPSEAVQMLRALSNLPEIEKLKAEDGRGQLVDLLGNRLRFSREIPSREGRHAKHVDAQAMFHELWTVLKDERPRLIELFGRQP